MPRVAAAAPAHAPEPEEEDDGGDHDQLHEPDGDVDQREVRGEDPRPGDADGVRERQALDERRTVGRDAEQRQQAHADREEQRVREQEADHAGSRTRPT